MFTDCSDVTRKSREVERQLMATVEDPANRSGFNTSHRKEWLRHPGQESEVIFFFKYLRKTYRDLSPETGSSRGRVSVQACQRWQLVGAKDLKSFK